MASWRVAEAHRQPGQLLEHRAGHQAPERQPEAAAGVALGLVVLVLNQGDGGLEHLCPTRRAGRPPRRRRPSC